MTSLVEKILAIAESLESAVISHAFGGALALAYCTEDPRGTRDVDVNAFLPTDEGARMLDALPSGVAVPAETAAVLAADGQVRLWWDDTPVDLFLDYAPLHAQAARGARLVPFAGRLISVLGPVELVLFKAWYDRPKDWVDITSVVENGAVDDPDEVRRGLIALLGADDPRIDRWEALTG